jgi:hypothetical protein
MKPPRQPPLLARADGQPPPPKRRCVSRFYKLGILIIGLLLLAQLWPALQHAQGRRELWIKTVELLWSRDTHIFAAVLLVNSLLYSLLVLCFYSTGAKTARGLARAILLLKADEFNPDSEGNELKHFFLIFVLPVLFIGAGTVEYHLLQEWLHGG